MTTERRYAPIGRGFYPENDYEVTGDWTFTGTVTFDDPVGTFTPGDHAHSADEITSGTFADALIAESNVTQHQAALSIAYAQITGAPDPGAVDWDDITGKPSSFPPSSHTHDLVTDVFGQLDDGNLSSNVALLDRTPQTFTGANRFRTLRIEDSGATDYMQFTHDGSDLLVNGVGTAEFASDTPMAVRADTSYFYSESSAAAGYAYVGGYNTESGALGEIYVYGSTGHGTYGAGAVLQFSDGSGENGLWLGGSGTRRYAHLHRPSTTKYFDIQDATRLRVFDDAETDYVEMYHDGNDFNFAFTNTTNANFSVGIDVTGASLFSSTVTASNLFINTGATPGIRFIETGVTAENTVWEWRVDGETFTGRVLNDAANSQTTWLAVDRTNNTVDRINLLATEVQLDVTTMDFNGTFDVDGLAHDISGTSVTLSGTGETMATFIDDGAVTLYYDNTAKIATSSAGVDVLAGKLLTVASATGTAGFRLPHGTAPSSPVDGDMWTTTAGLYVRINGVTVGPLT